MIGLLIIVVIALAVTLIGVSAIHLSYRSRRPSRIPATGARRILFPFVANALSVRALDAALRLAHAEDATLLPVFLARVPLQLRLDTPLPRQSNLALSLPEAIEQRATVFGIAIDPCVERGRTYRHALRQTIATERFDRMVVAAAPHDRHGFDPDDVAWLLENAPGRSWSFDPTRMSSSLRRPSPDRIAEPAAPEPSPGAAQPQTQN